MLLALDTSLDATSAAVSLPDGDVVAARIEVGAARQAEWLMPMIEGVLHDAAIAPRALSRIGVSVGPGSFTGLRIALAAARAMGTALGIPVIGVTTTQLVHASAPTGAPVLVALDARHGRFYAEGFDASGASRTGPYMAEDGGDLAAGLCAGFAGAWPVPLIVGSGARSAHDLLIALGLEARLHEVELLPDARAMLPWLARQQGRVGEMPAPLYLRGVDARTLAERGL